ncbi:hypothetical protein [Thalassotalea sp. ND16A]|uniref:hypothetical protein n=1 Tax=Thalassotalea sp. ND16A TaxID=1535422 RepID=UPI000519FBF8|nr:hypothetical protein [Thalassotalea sp. ND16A]KGJ98078.1 hypothetical protein ND16A_0883 [Thalassotalea sp. ND16A]
MQLSNISAMVLTENKNNKGKRMTAKIRKAKKKPVKHATEKRAEKWSDNIFLYTVVVIVLVIVVMAFVI